MVYWAVSDLNVDELQQFVRLLQETNQARLAEHFPSPGI
jgi:hypothetical protein